MEVEKNLEIRYLGSTRDIWQPYDLVRLGERSSPADVEVPLVQIAVNKRPAASPDGVTSTTAFSRPLRPVNGNCDCGIYNSPIRFLRKELRHEFRISQGREAVSGPFVVSNGLQ